MSNNNENIKNVTNKSKLNNRTLGLKRWLSFIVTLSMIMSLIILPEITVHAAYTGSYSGGSGTSSDPYQIKTTTDLSNFFLDERETGYYSIMNDIGTASSPVNIISGKKKFGGVLRGNFHTVHINAVYSTNGYGSGYVIDTNNGYCVYLINELTGQIYDLIMRGSVGGEADTVYPIGRIESTGIVSQVEFPGGFSDYFYVYGIAGVNCGEIRDCIAHDVEVGGSLSDKRVYGMVGNNLGTIKNCFYDGNLPLDYAVAEANTGTITNCWATSGDTSAGGSIYSTANPKEPTCTFLSGTEGLWFGNIEHGTTKKSTEIPLEFINEFLQENATYSWNYAFGRQTITSSNPNIVSAETVFPTDGSVGYWLVKANGYGSCTLTVNVPAFVAANGTYYKAAKWVYNVNVPKKTPTFGGSTSFSKTYGDAAFGLGQSVNSGGALSYSSSNSNVATVDSSGIVTVVGAGTATITVTAAETSTYASASRSVTVTVGRMSRTITTPTTSFTKVLGTGTFSLGASITYGSMAYSSSNPNVATVSSGVVTMKSAGSTTITVSSVANSNYNDAESKTISITVLDRVKFTKNTFATACKGSSYYQVVGTASGGFGSYTYSISSGSLPTGLALSSDGVIQGTATTSGVYDFTVKVTDSSGATASSSCRIVVVDSLSFSGGSGDKNDPYLISTQKDLETMRSMSLNGETFEGQHFKLINDINLRDWNGGIGNFAGHFDGDKHIIYYDVYLDDNTDFYCYCESALFSQIKDGALIENLGFDGQIEDDTECESWGEGGIANFMSGGTIRNCYSLVCVYVDYNYHMYGEVGGMVAYMTGGTIENCYYSGWLEGNTSMNTTNYNYANYSVGGIVGVISGSKSVNIINCYNGGYVLYGTYMGHIAASIENSNANLINCYGKERGLNGDDWVTDSPYSKKSEKDYVTLKTPEEMESAEFVTALGGAYIRNKAKVNNYEGLATPILWLTDPVNISFSWSNKTQTYDGSAKSLKMTARNSQNSRSIILEDGDYVITYNGSTDAPSAVGEYAVNVTLTDAGRKYFNIASGGTSTLTINAGVPGAPTGLATENNEGGSVKLTWTAPEETGGQAIASYNVYYREKAAEGQPEQEWAVINGIEATEYTVTNLTPAKVYEFKVNAYNGGKIGAESEVAEQFVAKEPIAPVIGELISKNASIEITSVEVSDNFGDAVNKYSIYVSRKNEDGSFGEYTKLSEIETKTDSSSNILASGLEICVKKVSKKDALFLT